MSRSCLLQGLCLLVLIATCAHGRTSVLENDRAVSIQNADPSIGTPTNQYAVMFHPEHETSVDLDKFAARFRLQYARKLRLHRAVHLFTHEEPEANDITHQLVRAPEVAWAERQYVKERVLRTNDPLWPSQWNMHDTPGVDLNITSAWDMGFSGDGVLVCIVDDGLEWKHNEFDDKYVPEASWDINYRDPDPSPLPFETHGTGCAGAALGQANNFVCGAGVAPNASVSGIRLIARGATDANEAEGLSYRSDINDIYSNSWGPNDNGKTMDAPGTLTVAAMQDSIRFGRGGRGSIYVWAAGNGQADRDQCNYDGYANSRYTITVGAYDYNGQQAYYSESCAALTVVAPSSGAGHYVNTASTNNQCNTRFGGTSASCPQISGVVALMLEARPELTWRDVQGVLIRSALRIRENDPGWALNGAGLWVSHKFGYGRIDAARTVGASLSWELLPAYDESAKLESSAPNLPIPELSGRASDSLRVSTNLTIEHVEITVDIDHENRGELFIQLTSPMGTLSVLADSRADTYSSFKWTYTTNMLWGEWSAGDWTISVVDVRSNGAVGYLRSWGVKVYGH